jgi:crotonobetainyl-CoA:carnitine CoA-transferase CaiB-like acyl-CoA transferase
MTETLDGTTLLPLPLEGVRIVECGVWHAGPGAAAILADLGAEVIKIEPLAGDDERRFGTFGQTERFTGDDRTDWTPIYEISNRNKKGIALEITSEEGREILGKLVATADIFVTNMRKPTVSKLGLDYETLSKRNSKLIHMSVSGFGAEGPMAGVGALEPTGQAISGMAFLAGSEQPTVLQLVLLDQMTAITASHAMLTALYVRDRTGRGQALHASLYGSAMWMMYANIFGSSVTHTNLMRPWDRTGIPPMRSTYRCSDGKWVMGACHPEHKYWSAFCDALGLTELEHDPRFATPDARSANNAELFAIVEKVILTKTRAEWLDLFARNNLNFAPVHDYFDILEDPQAQANGYVFDYEHPIMGKVSLPGYPIQFSANRTRFEPAPALGEHTDLILSEIGLGSSDIAGLREAGVVK